MSLFFFKLVALQLFLFALNVQAKAHILPRLSSSSRSCHPFEILFTYEWGPTPQLFSNGSHYYLMIVYDFSKFIWFFSMQLKSNITPLIIALICFIHNTFFTIIPIRLG